MNEWEGEAGAIPIGRKNILLTGVPGVGKTTVLVRLARLLGDLEIAGFYTEEIRERGTRMGFRAVAFSGGSAVMAHVAFDHPRRVGRYRVDLDSFERLILPGVECDCDLLLIDEIGKMECFSERFIVEARRRLDGSTPVIATVAISGRGFIAEVKERTDVAIVTVTRANREALPRRLAEEIRRIAGR